MALAILGKVVVKERVMCAVLAGQADWRSTRSNVARLSRNLDGDEGATTLVAIDCDLEKVLRQACL